MSGGYQDWTDVLLDVLSDDYSRRIFASAIPRGKTIEELCLELRIPLSSCYRKVALMVERGVMIIERRTVARRGGRYAAYRSVFERVSVELKDGKVSVEVSLNRETLQNPNYRRAATTWEAGRAEAIVDLLNR